MSHPQSNRLISPSKDGRRWQYKLSTLFIVTAIIALGLTGLKALFAPQYTWFTFDLPQGRSIVILGDNYGENGGRSFYYEVYDDGILVVPRTYMNSYFDDEMDLFLITTRNKDLVGIASKALNDEPVFIHDFSTGESWPLTCDGPYGNDVPPALLKKWEAVQKSETP